MSFALNARAGKIDAPVRRKLHVLVEFPDLRLECVVVQWDRFAPTVLVQMKRDLREPLQFPGKRADVPGNETLPKEPPSRLDFALHDFVDASTGRVFGREACFADI